MVRLLVLVFMVASFAMGIPLNNDLYNKKDILELSQQAVREGVERTLKSASEKIVSEFDNLEYNIKMNNYKSKKSIKGIFTIYKKYFLIETKKFYFLILKINNY